MKRMLKMTGLLLVYLVAVGLGSISQGAQAKAVEYSSRCSYEDFKSTTNYQGMERLYQIYNYQYYWQGDTVNINFLGSTSNDNVYGFVNAINGDSSLYLPLETSINGINWKVNTEGWNAGKYEYLLTPKYSGKIAKNETGYFYILSHPADAEAYEGESATFSVGEAGYSDLTYQWYYSSSETGTDGVRIPNANMYTYTVPASEVNAANHGRYYFCKITQKAQKIGANRVVTAAKSYSSFSKHAKLGVKYHVSYDANGGISAPAVQTKYHDRELTLSDIAPVRDGYKFLGWSESIKALKAEYKAGEGYSANKSAVLYAVWEKNTYTVAYDGDGGSPVPPDQIKKYDEPLVLSGAVPVKQGYEFKGWQDIEGRAMIYQPGDSYLKNEDLALRAVWEKKKYTVTYDLNGGSGTFTDQIKDYGETVKISAIQPERTGYDFKGWAEGNGTVPKYQPGDIYRADADITLRAIWEKKTYTIIYDTDGGFRGPSDQTKDYGVAATISSIRPEKAGYEFAGWAERSGAVPDYQPGDIYNIDANLTLHAVWEKKIYTVHYNANGGDGAPDDQTKEYDEILIMSSVEPEREGYEFIGWGTYYENTPSYQPGDYYDKNESIWFYAIWEPVRSQPEIKKIAGSIYVKKTWNKAYGAKKFSLDADTNSTADINYKSTNNNVAAVNNSGIVTIKNYGEARIKLSVRSTSEYTACTETVRIVVTPKRPVILSLTSPKSAQLRCRIKKQPGVTGFYIFIKAPSGQYKNITIHKLSYNARYASKRKYKVKIRAYKVVGGKKYVGAWSKTKTVKTK